jgi:hypothetical protein
MRRIASLASLLAAVLLPSGGGWSDSFPDDHGDDSARATPVETGGAAIGGAIEIDIDRDWFSFRALPGIVHRIQATASNIWDVELEFRAPDGQTLLATTNSARSVAPVQAEVIWTNPGAAGICYVGIAGHLEFTTGTYSVAVSPLNFTDADGDGMNDTWEVLHFGDLSAAPDGDPDTDATSNLGEFYMMTDPTNGASALAIASLGAATNGLEIGWTASPFGLYRLSAATGSTAAAWAVVATNYFASPSPGLAATADATAAGSTQKAYRVEFIY